MKREYMHDATEIYLDVLRTFNAYRDADNCPQTRSYVGMDDIHNAIVINGVHMDNEPRFYVIKAKQCALNERAKIARQYKILRDGAPRSGSQEFNENVLDMFGFTSDERAVALERVNGIPAYKSKIGRKRYEKILDSVKEKLLSHYKT